MRDTRLPQQSRERALISSTEPLRRVRRVGRRGSRLADANEPHERLRGEFLRGASLEKEASESRERGRDRCAAKAGRVEITVTTHRRSSFNSERDIASERADGVRESA